LSKIEYLQNPVITNVLSLIIGMIGSYLVWWYTSQKWIPSICFGSEICKYSVGENESLYVCAFENSGRRDIVDVEVVTRIGVKRFGGSGNWIYFSLKTNASQVPNIEPGRRALIRIMDERETPLYIDQPPPSLRKNLEACKTLECVFAVAEEVEVRIHVYGYDSFSGVRRHYSSPAYFRQDIRSGKLKGLVVVHA
jgi:hypothetical protein